MPTHAVALPPPSGAVYRLCPARGLIYARTRYRVCAKYASRSANILFLSDWQSKHFGVIHISISEISVIPFCWHYHKLLPCFGQQTLRSASAIFNFCNFQLRIVSRRLDRAAKHQVCVLPGALPEHRHQHANVNYTNVQMRAFAIACRLTLLALKRA